jgi:hypothetical protein
VVGILVLVAAAGGYAGYGQLAGPSSSVAAVHVPCPSPSPSVAVAQQARLAVRNATLQTGLAARVARHLRSRHFSIGSIGNTLFRGKGVATVKFSADRLQAAQLVAAQFAGATMVRVPGSGVLELDIGPRFRGLVPLGRSQAAERAILGTSSPRPVATPRRRCGTG